MKYDFELENHGSIVLLRPLTKVARAWVSDNLPDDAPRWAGAVAVEPRFIDAIIDGLSNDGLTL